MADLLIPLGGLAYVGVWIVFMASSARRSARSLLFLIATSIPLLLVSSAEPWLYATVVRFVGIVWVLGLSHFGDILSPMRSVEARFKSGPVVHLRSGVEPPPETQRGQLGGRPN